MVSRERHVVCVCRRRLACKCLDLRVIQFALFQYEIWTTFRVNTVLEMKKGFLASSDSRSTLYRDRDTRSTQKSLISTITACPMNKVDYIYKQLLRWISQPSNLALYMLLWAHNFFPTFHPVPNLLLTERVINWYGVEYYPRWYFIFRMHVQRCLSCMTCSFFS